jgi:hypothetical protein
MLKNVLTRNFGHVSGSAALINECKMLNKTFDLELMSGVSGGNSKTVMVANISPQNSFMNLKLTSFMLKKCVNSKFWPCLQLRSTGIYKRI